MCKVSVIIPVYNAAKYLRECLDSILNQTLRDIEVICVDDGSTDNSLTILSEYANKDSRVKIIQQKNQFAGVARNNGMRKARGEYLAFIDSDDFFELDGLENLYSLCIKYNLDFVKCSSFVFDNKTKENRKEDYFINANFPKDSRNKVVNFKETLDLVKVGDVPWNGLYKKEFLQQYDIQFPDLFAINDHSFFIHCLICASRVMVSDVYFAHYRVNVKGTIIAKKAYHFDCQIKNYTIVKKIVEELDVKYREYLLQRELFSLFHWYYRLFKTRKNILNNRTLLEKFCKSMDETDVGDEYLNHFTYAREFAYFHNKPDINYMTKLSTEPQISVIIPVYNTADYLCECLDSILSQSFHNFELVIVDDGSTDGSSDIIQEYAQKDCRVHIFDSEHKGAGHVRTLGVEQARGKYVQFLDSDDWLDKNTFKVLWPIITKLDVDLCSYNYANLDSKTNQIISTTSGIDDEHVPKTIFCYKDCPNYIFQVVTPSLVTKIFKRTFISQYIGLSNGLNGTEDVVPAYVSALYAKKIIHVEQVFYYYRRNRGGSLETTKDAYPLNFIDGYKRLDGLVYQFKEYKMIAQSCSNRILRGLVYELLSKKTSTGYQETYNYLVQKGFQEFGLKDNQSYYYSRQDYNVLHYLLAYPNIQFNAADLKRLSVMEDIEEAEINQIISKYRFIEKLRQSRTEPQYEVISDQRDMNHVPKVSVVVPLYNDEKYIAECIDHLLKQTLKDIEVICVNDGSNDDSLKVLKSISDKRLIIISKENQGQAVARNIGTLFAKGEYLYFCDADDYIDNEALECLYKKAVETDSDTVLFNANAFFESAELQARFSSYEKYYQRIHNYEGIYSGISIVQELRQNDEYLPAPVLSFVNRKFYSQNDITFIPGIIHEDNIYTFQLLMLSSKVTFIPKTYYHRRVRKSSTMTKKQGFANVYGYFLCLLHGVDFIDRIQINEKTQNGVSSILEEWLRNARNIYNNLSPEEKRTIELLDNSREKILFKLFHIDSPEQQTHIVYDDFFRQELENVKSGYSFRIGRVITWLPRKLRGGIWCLRDNGLEYTLKRIIEHMGIDMKTGDFKKAR